MKRAIFAVLALVTATAAFADHRVSHSFSTSAALGSARRLVVDVPAADVKIRNGAGDTIKVTGVVRRESDYDNMAKNQRIVDDASVMLYVGGADAIVRRKFGPNAQGWRAQNHNTEWDLEIEVPPGVAVKVETKYGDVAFNGTFGGIDVDLRAGDINIQTPRASVRELNASVRVGEVHTHLGDRIIESEGVLPRQTKWTNKDVLAGSTVNAHATAGDVDVMLTQ